MHKVEGAAARCVTLPSTLAQPLNIYEVVGDALHIVPVAINERVAEPARANAVVHPHDVLRDAVNLVVSLSVGEGEQLTFELGQPVRILGEQDTTSFDGAACLIDPRCFAE